MDHVIWHDVECGGYDADLPLWRTVADEVGGPVLDLGAGTGRVTLDLARHGHEVHAVDVDEVLLAALRARAEALPVVAHAADVRELDLPGAGRFRLALAPMQTVQLLGGADGRARLLAGVRRHLAPGGLLFSAVAQSVEAYADAAVVPVPDMREVEGVLYASRPVAIREEPGGFVLERLREKVTAEGRRDVTENRVRLDHLAPDTLEDEGRAAGFAVEPRRVIAATEEHVGSEVVVLRA